MTHRHSQPLLALIAAAALLAGWDRPAFASLLAQDLRAFRVPSDAMAPTLILGDFVYVDHTFLSHSAAVPLFGAIVVFRSVEEPDLEALKRVIGLPEDTLAMRNDTLYRNGRRVHEPYAVYRTPEPEPLAGMEEKMRALQLPHLVHAADDYAPDNHTWGPLRVPPRVVFVLGDNRNHSYDSRHFGFVPLDDLIGAVLAIYWSWDPVTHDPRPERLGRVQR